MSIRETLTNVVIPAFDIKILQPVIFNTHDVIKIMSGFIFYFFLNYKFIRTNIFIFKHLKSYWSGVNITQAKVNALKNPRLADVCLATSAAPIFLPVHFFETKDDVANTTRTYDLIDGAIAINNPVSYFR